MRYPQAGKHGKIKEVNKNQKNENIKEVCNEYNPCYCRKIEGKILKAGY